MLKKKLIVTFLIFLGFIFIISGIFYGLNKKQIDFIISDIKSKKDSMNDNTFKRTGYTIIYDKNNNIISKLVAKEYFYEKKENIPDKVSYAFIAIEDKNFKKHKGLSIKGSSRALIAAIKNKGKVTQGGSTITQQLVKNVFLTNKKTISRKVEEMILAVHLERKYNKDEIMEFYLNNIYFGNGAFGIETASKKYFNKTSKQLSLSEIAFLAAIPNNPSIYDPINHKDNTIKRQNLILKSMLDEKYINQDDYEKALKEDIKLNLSKPETFHDNYLTSLAIDNSVRQLMYQDDFEFKYNFKDNKAKEEYQKKFKELYSDYDKKIRNGGYLIYTSLDPEKQQQLQESISSGLEDFSEKDTCSGKYKMQAAGVCIDNDTGYIIAAVGGRNADDEFNRTFLAYRQPGSAIKPFLAYTPAFDNRYHPLSIMNDSYIPNGPRNAEQAYFGSISFRYAVEMSLNTIPFKLMNKLGPDKCIPYLLDMDFNGIYKEDYNAIATIGGFTKGASPVEMAGAYSTLAHEGKFTKNTCIKKICYQTGNILVENKDKLERKKVYRPESAYMMTDILKGVLTQPHATGHGLTLANGHIAAGKTGTTEDCKDGWFCGYTKYYTTVIWCGYDMPESVQKLYGATYPGHIWKDFMDKIHSNKKILDFEKPSTIVFKNINPSTGEIVNYDSGTKDMFSQPILDEIEQEKIKKEEEERARKEAEYRAKEPERQAQVEKNIKSYEESHYTDINSIFLMDNLLEKINSELKQLLDANKTEEYNKRVIKRTEELREERENCIKLRNEKIEKDRQAEQERLRIEEEQQRVEREKQRIRNEQQKIASETLKAQEELKKEQEASAAVKAVLDFPINSKKDDPNYISAVKAAEDKISKLTNPSIANELMKALNDKTNSLQK